MADPFQPDTPHRNLAGKTMLLGIGAQKAGTTWLDRYLRAAPEVYLPAIKELHFFDSWLMPERPPDFDAIFRQRLHALEAKGGKPTPELQTARDRVLMIADRAAYLKHFDNNVGPKHSVFGEITPAYAMLDAQGFRTVANLVAANGVALKLLFIMRDPIDRYFSALRMREKIDAEFSALDCFEAYLDDDGYVSRGRYDLTIQNLRAVFSPSNVHYAFYETLFTPGAIQAITGFLGVPYRVPDFQKKILAGPVSRAPTPRQIALAREKYEPVYAFCRREFGTLVPANWAP
ncbi:MAG TPA: sulfotransferase domain-containing protein [Rhizomicrobium sp.]|jgi:hypothetical protein